MQKVFMFITAGALMAGVVLAKDESKTIDDIFSDLSKYNAAAKPQQPADMEKMVSGDALAEIQGVKAAVNIDPENRALRMYPKAQLKGGHRSAEMQGMAAVNEAWSTDMVFRSYPLGKGASAKIGLGDITNSVDVSDVFWQVDFPKGSSAIYQPKMETLFVRNTRENFVVLEAILGAMNLAGLSVDVDQVEIEAKFVEVSEGALEALGFQWNIQNTRSLGGDMVIDDGNSGLFANALRGSPSGLSPNIPFTRSDDAGGGRLPASGDWGTFGFLETFNKQPDSLEVNYTGSNPVDLLISALDQSSGTDVLSAPRITTRSGEEATIRVGELHYFPEVFEGNASVATMLSASYQDFEEKLLGVELSVTPEVDGGQINLALNPKITEIAGWQSYELAPANSVYTYRTTSIVQTFKHDAVVGKIPIYKKREIETEVTIADGSTIGMGGLISEKRESFEDKVPLLGSLPLVGRLFRNEGERSVKRNLLMFVTAKTVDPSGRINTVRSVE